VKAASFRRNSKYEPTGAIINSWYNFANPYVAKTDIENNTISGGTARYD
jgi:hypothetical protein